MERLVLVSLLLILLGEFSLANRCPHTLSHCVKGCPETNDLISDKESGGLTDTTKKLIQRTLDERSCGEKSEGKYCCAKEPVVQVNEPECKFLTNLVCNFIWLKHKNSGGRLEKLGVHTSIQAFF